MSSGFREQLTTELRIARGESVLNSLARRGQEGLELPRERVAGVDKNAQRLVEVAGGIAFGFALGELPGSCRRAYRFAASTSDQSLVEALLMS